MCFTFYTYIEHVAQISLDAFIRKWMIYGKVAELYWCGYEIHHANT